MNVVRTVVIQETGEVVLPRETLEESHISAGAELVVVAHAGQILLLDREQIRRRIEEIGHQMQEALRTSLAREGKDAVFAGLSLDEYLALSEEEDKALWDRLVKETEQELKIREPELWHLLERPANLPVARPFLPYLRRLQPGRYLKRWSRRLTEEGFSRNFRP